MKKQPSMKVFTVLRYVLLGGILGYLIAEAVIHGFFDRYLQIPSFHALCPFEAFGSFLNTITGLEFFSNPFASASVFFIVFIIFAILLNRVFCGFLCAFGALQEFTGNLGAKLLKKRFVIPKRVDKILRGLKYVFLVLSILLAYFSGYEFFRNLIGLTQGSDAFSYIDPWIAFKSLFSNNLLVTGYISSLAVLVISLVGSFFFQRFYCKYACPLGGVLAIFGSLSGLHVHRRVNPEAISITPVSESNTYELYNEEGNSCGDCTSCNFCATKPEANAFEASVNEITELSNDADSQYYSEDEAYDEYEEYYDDEYEEEPEEDNFCINCGKCTEVCPMGIDVAATNGNVDFAECIACQKCVAACPQKGALQTRYFKKKTHPILILLITVVLFFGVTFALNFIKVDRGGPAKEPIYDSIRVNPLIDANFDVDEFLASSTASFSNIKNNLFYSEIAEATTLEYCKTNASDFYFDALKVFGISEDTPLDTTFMELLNNAPISVAAEYIGFDSEKMTDFAAYFNATPEDSFGKISEEFYTLSDEFFEYVFKSSEEIMNLTEAYKFWHQCSYGPEYTATKNFLELLTNCKFETDLYQYFKSPEYNVEAMLDIEGISLSELKEIYHISDDLTLSSTYAEFQDAVMLSYYAEYASESEEQPDILASILEIYGIPVEEADLTMTIGELLDSGTVLQAAEFMGCKSEEDLENFKKEYSITDMNEPYTKYHQAVNDATDEYYNMLYVYYYSN